MSKIYIDYKDGRKFYAYSHKDDKISFIPLSPREIDIVLKTILNGNLSKVLDKQHSTEIFYHNMSIIIDNVNVFAQSQDRYDAVFQKLLKEITSDMVMTKYRKTLPSNYTPKVNRRKKIGKKLQVIAGSLSFVTLLSLTSGLWVRTKTSSKLMDNSNQIATTMSTLPEEVLKATDGLIIYDDLVFNQQTDSAVNVQLAFADETESGKLEQTIELCATYLDKWIERYGLPRDLTYALVSQESGLLDCTVNSGGACGPMQIQVEAFHNDNDIEFCQVPVYENGEFTGEYDEFYIADATKLDDPRLEGKNYLVIQNLEDNFQIGCAMLRRCIDKYKNIFIAIDAYNKGLYALSSVCDENSLEHYQNDFSDFSWVNLIPNKYGEDYGDKDYIWHVLRYLDTDNRGEATIEYYYEGEKIVVELTNTNVYSNEIVR